MPHRPRHFASDNNSGVCPEVLAALAQVEVGHLPGYGDDAFTARACDLVRALFDTACDVFFVFNGTAANALSLAAICRPYHAVLCHASSHVQHDECGAPEFFSGGAKLLPLPGDHGRLSPAVVTGAVRDHFPLHSSRPAAVTLTQATECGTVYTVDEVRAVAEAAHANGLKVHMDGARFANAVASLGCSPKALTWEAGVDVLSFGGTKNGGLMAEAIVVFDRALAAELDYRIKQAGQLASKMRYPAASWIGLLGTGAWLRHAEHANAMARRLATALEPLPGLQLLHPVQANGVFVDLPEKLINGLREAGWRFYVFEGRTGCRLMCSWDTTEEDVDGFVRDAERLLGGPRAALKRSPRTRRAPAPGKTSG